MGKRYPREGTPEQLCDHHAFGKHGRVPIKHELTRTWMGLRIPAAEKREPAIVVQFSNRSKVPHFTIQARPFYAEELLREKHPGFVAASRKLQQCGFDSTGWSWSQVHQPEEWLHSDDVPQTLAGFVGTDIRNIVESGLFDEDVAAGVSPKKGVLRRWARTD